MACSSLTVGLYDRHMVSISRLLTCAFACLVPVALAGHPATQPEPSELSSLSGEWVLNRELSSTTPPAMGDEAFGGRPGGPGPGGRRPPGGIGGMGRGGGVGRGDGMGGGRSQRPTEDEMKRRRELMQEALEAPTRFTIIQDGQTVTFAHPNGVVRKYVANGKTEKHQLMAGTIDTKTRWDGSVLLMEIVLDERRTLTRRYRRDAETGRLLVTVSLQRDQEGRTTVYDEATGDGSR